MDKSIKERPIILTSQEVNAVLAGNKSQHRVPILIDEQAKEGFDWDFGADGDSAVFIKKIDDERQEVLLKPCPFGAIGDRLWVQEDWNTHTVFDNYSLSALSQVISINYIANGKDVRTGKFRPAKDMHRAASRVLLEITDISIERMQDISDADAIAMGVQIDANIFSMEKGTYHCMRPTAAQVIKDIYKFSDYDDTYFKYGENPWVWVIEFKVLT